MYSKQVIILLAYQTAFTQNFYFKMQTIKIIYLIKGGSIPTQMSFQYATFMRIRMIVNIRVMM